MFTKLALDFQLHSIRNWYVDQMNRLAGEVRQEVIIPFCRENQYSFYNRGDSWQFCDAKGWRVDEVALPERIVKVLQSTACSTGDCDPIYKYMTDYNYVL